MKTNISHLFYFFLCSLTLLGCKEESNYPGGKISPYFSIYDLRTLYKGEDLILTTDNMLGSDSLAAVVVSDHSGGNLPEGLLVVQDKRRLSQLRGISIEIGPEASNYLPGDSVNIKVSGGTLTRVNGHLEVVNIAPGNIRKVASNIALPPNQVPSSYITANPDKYESTLVVLTKASFDPLPAPTDTYVGSKLLNDGFDNINLFTETDATFANDQNLPINGNYYGIIFSTQQPDGNTAPQIRIRTAADVTKLSSVIEISPILIAGFASDIKGGDGNYEYMQFIATRDIDFAVTPFSVVVTSNAGASSPTGFPSLGWATGSLATKANARTFKFNLTEGTVTKGEYFYVGGSSQLINGSKSTSIASSKWIRSFNYTSQDGDGFGKATGGLFANSGNASGFAVFEGTDVNVDSTPIDVIFIGGGGSLFNDGTPPVGYKICNTDWYDVINPITLESQPYYKQGGNTLNLNYLTKDIGYFNLLGGEYNVNLGKWVKARAQVPVEMTKESTILEIENELSTKLK